MGDRVTLWMHVATVVIVFAGLSTIGWRDCTARRACTDRGETFIAFEGRVDRPICETDGGTLVRR